MQRTIVAACIELFETAERPRTTVRMPYRWSEDESWRVRYLEVRPEDVAELAARGAERRAFRERMRTEGRIRKN
jgi:hypothetical protein